jgi:hypothetical protein
MMERTNPIQPPQPSNGSRPSPYQEDQLVNGPQSAYSTDAASSSGGPAQCAGKIHRTIKAVYGQYRRTTNGYLDITINITSPGEVFYNGTQVGVEQTAGRIDKIPVELTYKLHTEYLPYNFHWRSRQLHVHWRRHQHARNRR